MRIVAAAILGFAVVACALASADEPGSLSVADIRQSLFGACATGERSGWMVGELGRIFRTEDGGGSWTRQSANTKRAILAISCLDDQRAWIAGKEGIVYQTKDGGRSWTQVQTGSQRHLFTIQFVNAQRGHAAGDFGTMIHTEDGGAKWAVEQVPPDVRLPDSALDTGVDPGDVNLYALSYGDADRVWVVGEFGIIMASDDGGKTWHQQVSPVETTLFGVRFIDTQHGWAVGSDAVILHTEDGGLTWRPQRSPITPRPLYDVAVQGQTGWIVGEAGTVIKSTDGGMTWAIEPLPIQLAANWIRTITLTAGARGFAGGAEGILFRIDGPKLQRLVATEGKQPS